MKLYVDDARTPDCPEWVIARNYWDAIEILANCQVTLLTVDHDLGDGPTGYDIICWLEEGLLKHGILPPKMIFCHSANPVGRGKIMAGIAVMKHYREFHNI